MIKRIEIRQAIREVLQKAHIAKETSNRELRLACNDWLHKHIKLRNSGKFIFYA